MLIETQFKELLLLLLLIGKPLCRVKMTFFTIGMLEPPAVVLVCWIDWL